MTLLTVVWNYIRR